MIHHTCKEDPFCDETNIGPNRKDDGTIWEDFDELHHLMNGMELREIDKIIYPV